MYATKASETFWNRLGVRGLADPIRIHDRAEARIAEVKPGALQAFAKRLP